MITGAWALTGIGIGFKLMTHKNSSVWSTLAYLGAGWMAVIALPELFKTIDSASFGLFLVGGLVYTAGAVFFYMPDRPEVRPTFGFHEMWHVFVMIASALHYAGVFRLLSLQMG
jgi:hemolysin III